MNASLWISGLIDRATLSIGRIVKWLILFAVLVSSGNAIVRKVFQTSSNGLLEVQWYLFSAVFMLCAGYAFLKNAHVRIDFISARLSANTRAWIDIAGIVLFLLPTCVLLIALSWPIVYNAWASGEVSPNAGGLLRWPVYLLLPLGMLLLMFQGVSELIKRIAFLRGLFQDPAVLDPVQPDEVRHESARDAGV